MRFGSADFEEENEAQELPSFPLFLARVSLNDVFSIGILPIADVLVYAVLYTILLRLDVHPVVSAIPCLASRRGHPDSVLCPDQEGPHWQQMGLCSLNAVLVLATLQLLLRSGLLLCLVQECPGNPVRYRALESHSAVDGVSDREAHHRNLAPAGSPTGTQ